MSYVTWPPKDPEETLFYELDWVTNRLDQGEDIVTSDWAVAKGSVVIEPSPAPDVSAGITKLWLSGGTLGETCLITNTVTTSIGQTREASARLKIRAK